jgi:hypothetical protein
MVTRTVICVSPSEAATLAAEASWSSREAHSIIKNASISTYSSNNSSDNESDGGKKRARPSGDIISGNESKRRQKADDRFEIDLSDVPPQLPIRVKEGSSKYAGVHFRKAKNKWQTQIKIEGKNRHIGYYENEEEAAIDYARAVFKYRGQDGLDKARMRKSDKEIRTRRQKQKVDRFVGAMDLSDVPPQPPIPKSEGHIKEGASKFTGVSFNKKMNKWRARILIEANERSIGYYESEEEAAIDYARAVFKYKGEGMKEA